MWIPLTSNGMTKKRHRMTEERNKTVIDLYRINLNLLVALDVLLQEKSVTLAANKLFLTQAAMSNNLQQLREIFKDELLIREKNYMVLTNFAKELQPKLHQILQEMHSLIVTGQSFVPNNSKRIFKIGVSDYMASIILPQLTAIIQEKAPDIRIEICNSLIAGNIEPFENGKYDLSIGKIIKLNHKLRSQLLFKDQVICILNERHPLAKKKKITLKDYTGAKHVALYAETMEAPNLTDQALAQIGQKRDIQIQVPFVGPIFKIIEEADHLIGSIIKHMAILYRDNYRFVIRDLPFEMPILEYYMVWHPRYESDPGHQWLRKQIAEIFQEK